MKVICSTLTPDGTPAVSISPDSALRLRNEPFFAPDDGTWSATIYIGARLSRQGLAIAGRFARRYYDSYTILAHPHSDNGPTPCEWTRDCALLNASDLSAQNIDADRPLSLDILDRLDGTTRTIHLATPGELDRRLTALISDISACHTLKTGDIVACDAALPPLSLRRGADYDISLNGHPLLRLKSR